MVTTGDTHRRGHFPTPGNDIGATGPGSLPFPRGCDTPTPTNPGWAF